MCIKYNPIKIRNTPGNTILPFLSILRPSLLHGKHPSGFYHQRLAWTVLSFLWWDYIACALESSSLLLSSFVHVVALSVQFFYFCLKNNFFFIAKLRERNRDFSYNPCPHVCTTFSIINISHQSDIFVTINEPTLTHHY